MIKEFATSWLTGLLASIAIFYILGTLIYRLYWHPLAKVPGPKIAAATWLYEIYFDLVLRGQFLFELKRLHELYGPIVRITPDEVHVNDPELIDVVYPGPGTQINKDPYLMRQFGPPHSGFLTIEHDLHKLRRSALNRYFSKAAVHKLEPLLREKADRLCERILEYAAAGPLTISAAFSTFATDVITEYCFNRSYSFLEGTDFLPNLQDGNVNIAEALPLLKQAPWLHSVMRLIPPSILKQSVPGIASWIKIEDGCRASVRECRASYQDGQSLKRHQTVIDELMQSSLPESEKQDERLTHEAVALVNAATETTTSSLSASTFYLLHRPDALEQLRTELQTIAGGVGAVPALTLLEQNAYFSAVIAETFRLSYGPVSRLPRIRPKDAVTLRSSSSSNGDERSALEYTIPPGYPLSMTSVLVHQNPAIFPDPKSFKPERWLDAEGKRSKRLDKYLLSFSRGSRACLGMNLAYAQLYVCMASVALKLGYRLQLYETTTEDVDVARDLFGIRVRKETKGVRVLVS